MYTAGGCGGSLNRHRTTLFTSLFLAGWKYGFVFVQVTQKGKNNRSQLCLTSKIKGHREVYKPGHS